MLHRYGIVSNADKATALQRAEDWERTQEATRMQASMHSQRIVAPLLQQPVMAGKEN